MAGSISLLGFSLVIFIQIMTHCHSSITTCLPEKHAALFILGDSLFDNGNNNYINTTTSYQANYPPYGETFFKYPSGRFSDGRMIPDAVGMIFIICCWFFLLKKKYHFLWILIKKTKLVIIKKHDSWFIFLLLIRSTSSKSSNIFFTMNYNLLRAIKLREKSIK